MRHERSCVCEFRFGESVVKQLMEARRSTRPDVNPWPARRMSMQKTQENLTMEEGLQNAQEANFNRR